MKVKVEISVMGSIDAQTRNFWDGSAVKYIYWDPKDSELCLNRVRPKKTLVEAHSNSDMQINHQIWV